MWDSVPDWEPYLWDSLSADQKRLFARMAEVFAGYMSYTDHQLGRVIDFLEVTGELDNTIVVVVSDNRGSGEGGRNGTSMDGLSSTAWFLIE